MKKTILIAATLAALLISNVAAAKYSDEYKAQHKRQVETITTQLPSGQKYTRDIFKLFDRQISGGKIRLKAEVGRPGPRILYLTYAATGKSYPTGINEMTWGDGKDAHKMRVFFYDYSRISHKNYTELAIATVNPERLKNAIVISVEGAAVFSESSKHWPEWKAALEDAEKLMGEK